AAFQPPEAIPYRLPDLSDTFASFKYRNACAISSLDLHAPFAPLCATRVAMLTAMSSGGRIGHDAPYMPRGCDMRWFTTEEACQILARFQKVIFVGDSMMRHALGSLNVLIRKDLGYGAVTDWNFSPDERRDCFCNQQFNVKSCSIQGIFKTEDVVKNDPSSLACPSGTVDLSNSPIVFRAAVEVIVRFPIPDDELSRFKAALGTVKPKKPYAFIFGHGLWNDLDLQATVDWLDTLLEATTSQQPHLGARGAFWPRLIITPNAAGRNKPDEWLVTQGNKALMIFEEAVALDARRRGIDSLGTWNMSAQSTKLDGVHADLRGNLIKAMMVLNWLNLLDVDSY
ncbi:MAG: hypothetical protein M1826_001670, partial [Phylliscum demangeonii]